MHISSNSMIIRQLAHLISEKLNDQHGLEITGYHGKNLIKDLPETSKIIPEVVEMCVPFIAVGQQQQESDSGYRRWHIQYSDHNWTTVGTTFKNGKFLKRFYVNTHCLQELYSHVRMMWNRAINQDLVYWYDKEMDTILEGSREEREDYCGRHNLTATTNAVALSVITSQINRIYTMNDTKNLPTLAALLEIQDKLLGREASAYNNRDMLREFKELERILDSTRFAAGETKYDLSSGIETW